MSSPTLLLTQSDVRGLATMELALAAVEAAFVAHGRGVALMPPKVYLELEHYDGDFRAMPSYLDGAAGIKWVNSHPRNPREHGLPAVMGLYILSDPSTAVPLAVMDATLLTAIRTGAAAGIGTKLLARKDSKSVGFIGCGVQAHHMHAAHRQVIGEFETLASDLSREAAENFAAEVGGRAVSLEDAAACDVVCIATPSRRPIILSGWVKEGTHINAMGADAPGKQELHPELLKHGLFVDDRKQACGSGEINVPLRDGLITEQDIKATIGEVAARRERGRRNDQQITVFDSTGLAIQDTALARRIYEAARGRGVGTEIDFLR